MLRFLPRSWVEFAGGGGVALPGPKGLNVEYFLWLVKDGGVAKLPRGEVAAMVDRAVREGPE